MPSTPQDSLIPKRNVCRNCFHQLVVFAFALPGAVPEAQVSKILFTKNHAEQVGNAAWQQEFERDNRPGERFALHHYMNPE